MNGHVIESTEDIRLLGVNNDVHFVISKHISEQCKKKKASQRLGVLSRLRNLIRTEAKLLSCTEILDIAIFSILRPYMPPL